MQIKIKVSTSWCFWFCCKWPDMSKVPKIGNWLYLCNILRKNCRNCFIVLLWCRTFRYFTGFHSRDTITGFSSECCKFFKNTYFEEHLPTAAFLPSFCISPIRIIKKLTSCYIWFHVVQMHYSARDHSFSTYAKFSEKVTFLTPWYAHQQRVRNVENFAYVLNQSSFLRSENRGKELALSLFLLLLLFCIFLFNLMIVTCLFNLIIVTCRSGLTEK